MVFLVIQRDTVINNILRDHMNIHNKKLASSASISKPGFMHLFIVILLTIAVLPQNIWASSSIFANPDLWVGTGDEVVPGTTRTAEQVANDYEPQLYLWSSIFDKCPRKIYYRVVKGHDNYGGFDAYLVQYFVYWDCQCSTIRPSELPRSI